MFLLYIFTLLLNVLQSNIVIFKKNYLFEIPCFNTNNILYYKMNMSIFEMSVQ